MNRESGSSRPFITGEVSISSPQWSPDGRSIYYTSKRAKNKTRRKAGPGLKRDIFNCQKYSYFRIFYIKMIEKKECFLVQAKQDVIVDDNETNIEDRKLIPPHSPR